MSETTKITSNRIIRSNPLHAIEQKEKSTQSSPEL